MLPRHYNITGVLVRFKNILINFIGILWIARIDVKCIRLSCESEPQGTQSLILFISLAIVCKMVASFTKFSLIIELCNFLFVQ